MNKKSIFVFTKVALAAVLFASASSAFAFNETICSGLVNGKVVAHGDRVSTGTLFQNPQVTVELRMDPATDDTEIQLVAMVKDRKPIDQNTKSFKIRGQQESLIQGSIAKIDTKFTTPGDGHTTTIQLTCENHWGD